MLFHQILDIDSNASKSEIKKAYRKKAIQLHPDRGGKMEDFIKLKEAYDFAINKIDKVTKEIEEVKERIKMEEQEAISMAKITKEIQKWCIEQESGTKQFSDIIECKKNNTDLRFIGAFLAGELSFRGDISIFGDVSSPLMALYKTVISGKNILIEGDISNGARINGKTITTNNVIGLFKHQIDATQDDTNKDLPLNTILSAKESIDLNECSGHVILSAKNIQVYDIKNGAKLIADNIIITGDIITSDCKIHARKTLRIIANHMSQMSDVCRIIIGKYEINLSILKKLKKVSKNKNEVKSGIYVTEKDIKRIKQKGWKVLVKK